MVVDDRGQFVSQRECASLRWLTATLPTVGAAELGAPGRPALQVEIGDGPRRTVTVWGDRVEAIDLGDAPSEWLTHWLERPLRLVAMPTDARRAVDPDYAESPDEIVSFADGFPLLLVSESSVAELGRRLEDAGARPVPASRFRANLVIRGATAFAEDQWSHVTVGDVRFRVAKPCARCVVTTIDQDGHGDASATKEPLRTLATFRDRPGGVMFGQNLVPCGVGTIRVGDAVVPTPR